MKRLNVLIATTKVWNSGDDIIRLGVEKLLTQVFDEYRIECNVFYYDKNPDLFEDYPRDWTMKKKDMRSNNANILLQYFTKNGYTNNDQSKNLNPFLDLIVFAGTPECFGTPCAPVYDYIATFPDTPCIILGAGWSNHGLSLTSNEKKVLNRKNTLITVRQSGRLAELIAQGAGLTNIPIQLPCPALFSTEAKKPTNDRTLFILQSPKQHQPNDYVLRKTVFTNKKHDFLCFYKNDYYHYVYEDPVLDRHKLMYSSEPKKLLNIIGQYSFVKSMRLHGAIPALNSALHVGILANQDNYRINTAWDLAKKYNTYENITNARNEYLTLIRTFMEEQVL